VAILIDTSVLVALERRDLELRDLFQLIVGNEPAAVSVMTVSELLAGAHLSLSGRRRRQRETRIEELIEIMQVIDFDLRAARQHSLIWADLRRTGQMIGPNDLIIAATALVNGYELLTENVREFERVPNLEVRRPAWP